MPLLVYALAAFGYVKLSSSFAVVSSYRLEKRPHFTHPNSECADNSIGIKILAYSGPLSSLASMEVGTYIEDLGLNVLVGKSINSQGRGLFVCVGKDIEVVSLPIGQQLHLCWSGEFKVEAEGDKTVGYSFDR